MVDEPGDTTPSEGGEESAGIEAGLPPAAEAISNGVAAWQRRGYHITYRDDFLAQMVRRGRPGVGTLALGLAAMGAVAVWWYMTRSWLVVSVTADPDGRLVVHRQRSRRPPPE
jgi:hypothetical protein